MGKTTTHVEGFTDAEAKGFIMSRADIMGLDSAALTERLLADVVRVSEASPLYIEDLMRLFAVMPPSDAVRMWAEKGGDEARKYALGREFELLSANAKHVLLAACIGSGPISFAELTAVTGLREGQLVAALAELQRLFLVPKPRVIEGEQRFEVNFNTRALVRRELESSDLYRRVEAAHRAVSGTLPNVGRGAVAAIVRQAVLHVRNKELARAEELLLQGLEKYPHHVDLIGVLGWVYKSWQPRRVTDARERFIRAFQLNSPEERMYRHWFNLEIQEGEWTKAIEAAECGLQSCQEIGCSCTWSGTGEVA